MVFESQKGGFCNVKVWFLRCKSMVFERQKPYFLIQKNGLS